MVTYVDIVIYSYIKIYFHFFLCFKISCIASDLDISSSSHCPPCRTGTTRPTWPSCSRTCRRYWSSCWSRVSWAAQGRRCETARSPWSVCTGSACCWRVPWAAAAPSTRSTGCWHGPRCRPRPATPSSAAPSACRRCSSGCDRHSLLTRLPSLPACAPARSWHGHSKVQCFGGEGSFCPRVVPLQKWLHFTRWSESGI